MFFDLHLHLSLKSFLTDEFPHHTDDCWTTYNNLISIIDSQSSAEQLWKGRISLAVTALYPLEEPFTSSFLIDHIAPVITPLSKKALGLPTGASGFSRLQQELQHLEKSMVKGARRFNILSDIREYDPTRLNVILAIEGNHALQQNNSLTADNLLALKTGPHRFLYLTLTHLTQTEVCTQAYGMKLIKNNDSFKPRGFGLTDRGKALIDLAYDDARGHRILIDIKHMSLRSRRDFYQYRKEKGYRQIPILATHMGCTGISLAPASIREQIKKEINRDRGFVEVKYERPEGIRRPRVYRTHFNPWSINLYDEEIPEILDSGGLIGVNLDKRILGAKPVKGEFFDEGEFLNMMGLRGEPEELLAHFQPGNEFDEEAELEGLALKAGRRRQYKNHLRHLCNNILHIVKIGGERAWDQICLGTDFDGLIDPVDNCCSSAEIPLLKRDLETTLREMISDARATDPSLDFHGGDLGKRVQGILFQNGYAFLHRWFG